MREERELLCRLALLAYERRLLDSAGGNVSARTSDGFLCSPRYAGSRRQWRIEPEDLLLLDLEGRIQEGHGEVSRETRMHAALYRAFPRAGAVFHAHPRHVLVFAHLRRPIPPASEQTMKYGVIPLTREASAHSEELADAVVETLAGQSVALERHAIACLIPNHGITVVGRDLNDAFDALERIDGVCHTHIAAAALRAADQAARD